MKLLEEFGVKTQEIDKFYKYLSLLLEWNEKFNLTAITDKDEIEEKIDEILVRLVKFKMKKNRIYVYREKEENRG